MFNVLGIMSYKNVYRKKKISILDTFVLRKYASAFYSIRMKLESLLVSLIPLQNLTCCCCS